MPVPAGDTEFTIDVLAARVGMTVRNVRAYTGRGLIPAPRLAGRTGYYNAVHVKRLQLIRELVDRGYTLSAVEHALRGQPETTMTHALDLLDVLESPIGTAEQPEVMSRDALTTLARLDRDDDLVDRLVELRLVEPHGDDRLTVLQPSVVRAGTSAIALGLAPETVLALLPILSDQLRQVADAFVSRVREQIWQPFVEAGMPEGDWQRVLSAIETLLPVAGQSVLSVFRGELDRAIHDAMGEELAALAERQGGGA